MTIKSQNVMYKNANIRKNKVIILLLQATINTKVNKQKALKK